MTRGMPPHVGGRAGDAPAWLFLPSSGHTMKTNADHMQKKCAPPQSEPKDSLILPRTSHETFAIVKGGEADSCYF